MLEEYKKSAGGTPQARRDSNIELFRIITMLLIVAHHYVVNSGIMAEVNAAPFGWRSVFLVIFGEWGKIGINCFVMITGYFMCKSNITVKKFVKLVGEFMFYKIVIAAVFWISGYEAFTFKGLVKTLLPITSVGTGFTSCFLIFYLFIPFLNIIVNKMTEKQHLRLIILCLFTYTFFGTFKFMPVTMNYVSWFIVLYFVASYIRLYKNEFFSKKKFWNIAFLILIVLDVASVVIGLWLGKRLDRTGLTFYFVTDSNTLLALLTGVSAFVVFKNTKIGYSKVINTVAASTFGVLCIHANSDTMRAWLWRDTLKNAEMFGSNLMPLHAILSVIGVFAACVLIDIVRINLIEKPFMRLWDKLAEKFGGKIKEKDEKILEKLNIEG